MKRINFLAVIALIALAGGLWFACSSGGGGGDAGDDYTSGWQGGKKPTESPGRGPGSQAGVPVTDIVYVGLPVIRTGSDVTVTLSAEVRPWNAEFNNPAFILWSVPAGTNTTTEYSISAGVLTVKDGYIPAGNLPEVIKVVATVLGASPSDTFTTTIEIPVFASETAASSIIITAPSVVYVDKDGKIVNGGGTPIAATVGPADATNKRIVWTKSASEGLFIDPLTGALYSVDDGYRVIDTANGDDITVTATIAKVGGTITDTTTYKVKLNTDKHIPVEKIVGDFTLYVDGNGDPYDVALDLSSIAKVLPRNATADTIVWTAPDDIASELGWDGLNTLTPSGYELTSGAFTLNFTAAIADGGKSIGTTYTQNIPVIVKTPGWIGAVIGWVGSSTASITPTSSGSIFSGNTTLTATVGPLNASKKTIDSWLATAIDNPAQSGFSVTNGIFQITVSSTTAAGYHFSSATGSNDFIIRAISTKADSNRKDAIGTATITVNQPSW